MAAPSPRENLQRAIGDAGTPGAIKGTSVGDLDARWCITGKLAATVADIGATPTTLIVSGAQTLGANLTIPATLSIILLKGAIITTTGYTLTFNGALGAGLYQIFSGSGTVRFGPSAVAEVYPQWWGAVADGNAANDDGPAINKAIDSLCSVSTYGAIGKVKLIGEFVVAETVRATATTQHMLLRIEGEGMHTCIKSRITTANNPVVQFGSSTAGSERASSFDLRDLSIIGSSAQANACLRIFKGHNFNVENVGFLPNGPGIEVFGAIGGRICRPIINSGALRNVWITKLSGVPNVTQTTFGIYVRAGIYVDDSTQDLAILQPTIDYGTYSIWVEREPVNNNNGAQGVVIQGPGYIQNMSEDAFTFKGEVGTARRLYNCAVRDIYVEGLGAGKRFVNAINVYQLTIDNVGLGGDPATSNILRCVECTDVFVKSTIVIGKIHFDNSTQVPENFIFLQSGSSGMAPLVDFPANDPLSYVAKRIIVGGGITGSSDYYGFVISNGNLRVANIGVGNTSAGSTLGSVVKKMPVYDQSGTLLGYGPLYDSIT